MNRYRVSVEVVAENEQTAISEAKDKLATGHNNATVEFLTSLAYIESLRGNPAPDLSKMGVQKVSEFPS